MSKYVLDSSIVLAVLFKERLNENALGFLEGAMMSSVNFAEVETKLLQAGLREADRVDAVLRLLRSIEPFTSEQARTTGFLYASTKHAGLSLADRACLSLAIHSDAEAITTDRAWGRVSVGCPIQIVR